MVYKYCVFGAGRQGIAVIYDLIRHCDAEEILVYEPNSDAMCNAMERLRQLLGHESNLILWTSTLNPKTTPDIDWLEFDVMISCAPWEANLELTKFAISNGVPFCDLGGNPDTVSKQEQLETNTAIVPDCGLSPGISNILAVSLARKGCDEIRVRCGGIPMMQGVGIGVDDLGFNYRLTFNAMGLISEYSGDVPIIINDEIRSVIALSSVDPYEDIYECSPTSNNSPQVVEYLHSLGVRDYDYMTIRYEGHWDLVRGWKAAGFLCGNPQMDQKLAEVLEQNHLLQYNPSIHIDKVLLSVEGKYNQGPARKTNGFSFEVLADHHTKFSAMELMTSWGITMVAHYMAKNSVPSGFATPERFVDATWILKGLERRLAKPPKGIEI